MSELIEAEDLFGSRSDAIDQEDVNKSIISQHTREEELLEHERDFGSPSCNYEEVLDSGLEVPLPRGPGTIGEGNLKGDVGGNVAICIPVGGVADDALIFVAEKNNRVTPNEIKIFNAVSGTYVRSITGNGKGSDDGQIGNLIYDLFISPTGPQNAQELYVADYSNHRVLVFNPWTGDYIRSIGDGKGSASGQLNGPSGLLVKPPSLPGGDYHLYVTEYNNNRVQVFDAVTGSHLNCIGSGKGSGPGKLQGPYGGVVLCPAEGQDASLELFVSEYDNNRVSVFDNTTGEFLRSIDNLNKPWGIAVSSTGVTKHGEDYLLYVAEYRDEYSQVQVRNARTGECVDSPLGEGERKSRLVGLKIHAALEGTSLLFVSDSGKRRVEVIALPPNDYDEEKQRKGGHNWLDSSFEYEESEESQHSFSFSRDGKVCARSRYLYGHEGSLADHTTRGTYKKNGSTLTMKFDKGGRAEYLCSCDNQEITSSDGSIYKLLK